MELSFSTSFEQKDMRTVPWGELPGQFYCRMDQRISATWHTLSPALAGVSETVSYVFRNIYAPLGIIASYLHRYIPRSDRINFYSTAASIMTNSVYTYCGGVNAPQTEFESRAVSSMHAVMQAAFKVQMCYVLYCDAFLFHKIIRHHKTQIDFQDSAVILASSVFLQAGVLYYLVKYSDDLTKGRFEQESLRQLMLDAQLPEALPTTALSGGLSRSKSIKLPTQPFTVSFSFKSKSSQNQEAFFILLNAAININRIGMRCMLNFLPNKILLFFRLLACVTNILDAKQVFSRQWLCVSIKALTGSRHHTALPRLDFLVYLRGRSWFNETKVQDTLIAEGKCMLCQDKRSKKCSEDMRSQHRIKVLHPSCLAKYLYRETDELFLRIENSAQCVYAQKGEYHEKIEVLKQSPKSAERIRACQDKMKGLLEFPQHVYTDLWLSNQSLYPSLYPSYLSVSYEEVFLFKSALVMRRNRRMKYDI